MQPTAVVDRRIPYDPIPKPTPTAIEEFQTPFELKLSRENRWIKLSRTLPWDALVKIYCRVLFKKHGHPAKNPRIVIGALIIKHYGSDER